MPRNDGILPALNNRTGCPQRESVHADQTCFGNYFGLVSAAGRSGYGPGSKAEPAKWESACRRSVGQAWRTRYYCETAATGRNGGSEGPERDGADAAARRESRAGATAGHRTDPRAKGGRPDRATERPGAPVWSAKRERRHAAWWWGRHNDIDCPPSCSWHGCCCPRRWYIPDGSRYREADRQERLW